MEDQKTGGFLDQARNHVWAGAYARGDALDCFTYHGGFALQMARRGARVTAYDLSAAAVARARENARRAGLAMAVEEANVFDVLPALFSRGLRYDTIVLDPPAFASTQKTVDAALRAYKEINLRAMRLLRPNSILVSCSCSGRVTPTDFDAMLQAAARDVRRPIHFVERWAAGPDHPVLAGVPETDYLKCRVLMVV
ncbi:MAG TPA: class I SAM-dependent methyltransferase, partial [Myxococcota bacterium]|nr:class I SAM-dependent methyltransferase [Myxococcota bacterium]